MQTVCIVGLGYVGLPTACVFAQSGVTTIGVDTRSERVASVNKGLSYIVERGISKAVQEEVESGRLRATTDLKAAVSGSEAVIIAVQTPFEGGKAVLDHLVSACEKVAESIKSGTVVIVESTVPPGTCERLVLPLFDRRGMNDGFEYYFAYCPERISPSNSLDEFRMNDRIIGANNQASLERGGSLMRTVVKGKLFATDLLTAETTKLVENASRDVYIAFANDLARICYHLGVDVHEVISLANTHPRVKILKPGPGVGGPCLTKDPYLLLEGLGERRGEEGLMIVTARSVNSGMTNAVLELAKADGGLRPGSKVVVLGTSYKPEVADPRSSPSEQVIKSLLQMGCKVSAYDPYCKEGFGAEIAENLAAATLNASCAIILVAHHSFQDLKLDELVSNMAPDPLIVDAAGTSRPRDAKSGKYRLRRLGDGKNSRMGTS